MPKFSIIVPIYRVEEYLTECIDSLLHQSFCDYEVILVDDGSPDGSAAICDQYARDYANVSVIHKKNSGVVNARNEGLRNAAGEYVVYVDGDDMIASDLLERLSETIDTYSPDMLLYDFSSFPEKYPDEISSNRLKEGAYSIDALQSIYPRLVYDRELHILNIGCVLPSIWSKAIKREFLLKYQFDVPTDIRVGEDLALSLLLMEHCTSIYVSHYSGYRYRVRENSAVNSFREDALLSDDILFRYLFKICNKTPKENVYAYAYHRIEAFVLSAIMSFSTYKEFVLCINKSFTKSLLSILQSKPVWKMRFRDYLKYIIISRKWYRLLWLWYRKQ